MDQINPKPHNWKSMKIKYLFEEFFGGSWGIDPKENQTEGLVNVIRVSEFKMNSLSINENIVTVRSLNLNKLSKKMVRKNDLILEKSGGGEKTAVGRVVLVDRNMKLPTVNSNFTNLCRPNKLVKPRFLVFSLNELYMRGVTKRNIKQTTGIQNLDTKEFINEKILLPSLKEQDLISNYLDKKTQKIDHLINKIEKKIEFLEKQHTALIKKYVTKGLDPKINMKDSGVKWIGNIPENWEIIKLKYFIEIKSGRDPSKIYSEDGLFDVLGTGGIIGKTNQTMFSNPSLILGRKGTIDKPFIQNNPFWISDVVYYTKSISYVSPLYLWFLFTQIDFSFYSYGSTLPSMSKDDYQNMKFPIPPIEELKQIEKVLKRNQLIQENIIRENKKKYHFLRNIVIH